jgi:hypothetical protein
MAEQVDRDATFADYVPDLVYEVQALMQQAR